MLVQERRGPAAASSRPNFWKLPTGLVEQGEDVPDAATREVFEETGVRTEFVSVLGIRHGHNAPFGKSDLFFLCALKIADGQQTHPIIVQETELAAAEWRDPADAFESAHIEGRTWTTCTGSAGRTPRASTTAWDGRRFPRGSAGKARWPRVATRRRRRARRRRRGTSANAPARSTYITRCGRFFMWLRSCGAFSVRLHRTRVYSRCAARDIDNRLPRFSPSQTVRARRESRGRDVPAAGGSILPRSRRTPPCGPPPMGATPCRRPPSTPSPCRGVVEKGTRFAVRVHERVNELQAGVGSNARGRRKAPLVGLQFLAEQLSSTTHAVASGLAARVVWLRRARRRRPAGRRLVRGVPSLGVADGPRAARALVSPRRSPLAGWSLAPRARSRRTGVRRRSAAARSCAWRIPKIPRILQRKWPIWGKHVAEQDARRGDVVPARHQRGVGGAGGRLSDTLRPCAPRRGR